MKPKERRTPCETVMLLVQRMESHPEEFQLGKGKWGHLMDIVKVHVVDGKKDALIILDDFETEMLWYKFKAAGQKQLRAYVMKTILIPEGEEDAK